MTKTNQHLSIFILLILFNLFNSCAATKTSDELYKEYFDLYPVQIAGDGIDPTMDSSWEEAMALYGNKDYANAITQIEELTKVPHFTGLDEAYLRIGIAQLELKRSALAISYLNRITPNTYTEQIARWYTSLAYLQLDQKEDAEKVLKDISNANKHYKKQEAKDILKAL